MENWKSVSDKIWIYRKTNQSLEKEWRGTESMLLVRPAWSFHSRWWGATASAGVGPLVFSQVQGQCSFLSRNSWHLMFPCADTPHWDADFNFSARPATSPHGKNQRKLVQWPWWDQAGLASKPAWPEPHRTLMGCCQETQESGQA